MAAETEIWADASELSPEATPAALAHVRNSAAAILLARPDQLAEWQPLERVKAASPAVLDLARSLAGARHVGVYISRLAVNRPQD